MTQKKKKAQIQKIFFCPQGLVLDPKGILEVTPAPPPTPILESELALVCPPPTAALLRGRSDPIGGGGGAPLRHEKPLGGSKITF